MHYRHSIGLRGGIFDLCPITTGNYSGLIRTHILVPAPHEPIFGLAKMEQLAHQGYRIGPGTLYPLLHGLERSGLLKSATKNVGEHSRRSYRITSTGKKALDKARAKVDA
jgi:PadR family transcriptional regulator, regulatory protein PadR